MYNVVLVSDVQQSDSVDLVYISIYVYTYIYFFIFFSILIYFSFQFSSVTQSCPTLCDPMDCHMPGFPVHHQLPELAQTHIHRVGNAIQPSHSLSSPSLPAFNLAQHQGLLQGVSCSHQVDKVSVLTMNIQDLFPLGLTHWISLQSKGLSRVFSNTTV